MNARSFVTRIACDDAGATAVEYALLIALIAISLLGLFTSIGSNFGATLDAASTAMEISTPS